MAPCNRSCPFSAARHYNYRSVVVIVGGSDIYNAFRSTSEYEHYDIGSHEQQNIR